MIAEGTDAGVFHEAERDLLEGVIRFADRPLRTIMVPRHAIIWIDADDPFEETLAEVLGAGHSRFPLCAGDIDNVIGFVHVKDMLELQLRGGTRPARGRARPALRQREHPGAAHDRALPQLGHPHRHGDRRIRQPRGPGRRPPTS